jgi:hypothetical protein
LKLLTCVLTHFAFEEVGVNIYKLRAAQLQATAETLMDQMLKFSTESPFGEGKRFTGKAAMEVLKEALLAKARERRLFRSLAVFDSKDNPESNLGLRAALNVLRSCLHRRNITAADLDILTKALNEPARLQVTRARPTKEQYLKVTEPQLREIVHSLSAYTHILTTNERLSGIAPIGECVGCGAIYLKAKRTQTFCSAKCRYEDWRKQKLAAEKDYYAKKMKASRKHNKAKMLAAKKRRF